MSFSAVGLSSRSSFNEMIHILIGVDTAAAADPLLAIGMPLLMGIL